MGWVRAGSGLDASLGAMFLAAAVGLRGPWLLLAPVEREGFLRAPVHVFVGSRAHGSWEVGYVERAGHRTWCDALTSLPDDSTSDPSPTQMKIDALRRWMTYSRDS